jgi:hypothetical protein
MVPLLWIAGAVHLLLVVVNLLAPRRLGYAEGLAGAPPIIRQIFHVHAAYIVLVLLGFAGLCLFFAPELAGGRGLGRFMSAFLAVFWLPRPFVQLLYYDPDLRRRHRLYDVGFLILFGFLAAVFTAAALGVGA